MPTGGRHEQDPTAIGKRLQEALAALLGLRILEPNRDRVTAQLAIWDHFAASPPALTLILLEFLRRE
jgi:hypothetical protein